VEQPVSFIARPTSRDTERSTSRLPDSLLLGVLLLIVAIAWPVYVFGGSQVAYVAAAAASALLGIRLALARSQALILLLVAEVGMLGTEANSALASGSPLLGTFRLVDITLAASLLGLGIAIARSGTAARARVGREIVELTRRRAVLATMLLLGWVAALWAAHGHLLDGITKTDIRILGLAVGTSIIACTCSVPPPADLAFALAALAPALATKSLAIYFSDLWVIGTDDRLQASISEVSGETRVILIGGDTILILVPALVAVALSRVRSRAARWTLWLCALTSVVGLFISGTRSGLLVAGLMVIFVFALHRRRITRPSARVIAAVAAIGAFAVGGLVATGAAQRFTTGDAPHVGLNFRADEFHSFFHLPVKDIVLGQGIGGRFVSKDINGEPVVTGWSHMFPIWILLKAGILGIAAVSVAALAILRRSFGSARARLTPTVELALVLLVGLFLMSLTIDRIALPEGGILVGLAIGLLGRQEA
jgi:hypothetical protein